MYNPQTGQDEPDNNQDPGAAPPPPADPNAGRRNFYNEGVANLDTWYQRYLGRKGDVNSEYLPRLTAAGYHGDQYAPIYGLTPHEQDIANSPEARAYAARPATAPTTPPKPEDTTKPPAPPPTTPMVDPTGNVPPGFGFVAPAPPWKPDATSTSFGSGFSGTIPTYTPAQISQYKPQDFSDIYAPQMARLKDILTNPVMDQNYINNLNEQQKELALQRGTDASKLSAQDAAHRGVSNGGYQAYDQRRLADLTTQDLLKSQRDVSNTATTSNRQGFLDALGMSNQTLTSDNNINLGNYGATLQGQQAQANENGRGYQSRLDALQAQLQRDTAFEQLRQGGNAQTNDLAKFFSQLSQNQNQFGRTLDFNYSGLNQKSLADYLASIFGK